MSIQLQDGAGFLWSVGVSDTTGIVSAVKGSSGFAPPLFLNDPTGSTSWQIGIDSEGELTSSPTAFSPAYVTAFALSGIYQLVVTSAGLLETTPILSALKIRDSAGFLWTISANNSTGKLSTTKGASGSAPPVYLNDQGSATSWLIGITTSGLPTSTPIPLNNQYPSAIVLSSYWSLVVTSGGIIETISGLKLEIWRSGDTGWTDYSSWIGQSGSNALVVKNHQLNGPQQITFYLQDGVPGFIVPTFGNRIRVMTSSYGAWFTGYLSAIPEKQLGGGANGAPVYLYKCLALSEELRLEWKTSVVFPTLAPFANVTQGAIIKALIAALDVATPPLDVTDVADGIVIPFFRTKPDEAFMDAVRRLSDKTNMAFWTKAGLAYYQPYSTSGVAQNFGYSPAESDAVFDPTKLNVTPVQNPVFNDVWAQGPNEPQNRVTEYFVGDGLTGIFPLKFTLFGQTSQLLLQDDFTQSGAINPTNWRQTDETDVNDLLTIPNGSLVMNAATPVNTLSWLSTMNGLEISGNLSLKAGQVTFAGPSNVLIGGLYKADSGQQADCILAFRCLPSGSQTVIDPLINGAIVPGYSYVTKPGKGYIFRISIDVNEAFRTHRPFFSLYNKYGGGSANANASVTFSLVEVDNNNPSAAAVPVTSYTTKYRNIPELLYYTLLAGPQNTIDTVSLTLNFCLLSIPVQGELWSLPQSVVTGDSFSGIALNSNWAINRGSFNIVGGNPDSYAYESDITEFVGVMRWRAGIFPNDQWAQMKIAALDNSVDANAAIGPAVRVDTGGADSYYGCRVNGNGQLSYVKRVTGTETNPVAASADGFVVIGDVIMIEATGTTITVYKNGTSVASWTDASLAAGAAGVTGIGASSGTGASNWAATPAAPVGWQRDLIGDASDPLARAAVTIGSDQNADLEFISLLQPAPGELIKFMYRAAAISRARVIKPSSVTIEAGNSGDDGVRAGTLPTQTPAPRTSAELESACQAFIDDRTSPLFSGDWTFDRKTYPAGNVEPLPGRLISVDAPSRYPQFISLVTQVDTSFEIQESNGDEFWTHKATFGPILRLDELSVEFQPPDEATTGQLDTLRDLTPISFDSVGTAFAPDVQDLDYSSRTPGTLVLDAGRNPTSAFEVRLSDAGWGTGSVINKALAPDPTTEIFAIKRLGPDTTVLIKDRDSSGSSPIVSRYASAIRFVWPMVPLVPQLDTTDLTDQTALTFNFLINPADDPNNVYAFEVRDSDNVTVLTPPGGVPVGYPPTLSWSYDNSTLQRTSFTFHVYLINLLGEYSPALVVSDVLGNVVDFGAAVNLASNSGFESMRGGYTIGIEAAEGQFVSDGWVAESYSDARMLVGTDNAVQRSGANSGRIRLKDSASIANGVTVEAALGFPADPKAGMDPSKAMPCRQGDIFYFGGFVRFDAGTGLPSGVTAYVKFRIAYVDAAGNIFQADQSVAVTVASGSWQYVDGYSAVTEDVIGVMFECVAGLSNASGSSLSTGTSNYLDAHFDDVFLNQAVRSSHSSYRPLSNPLTAHDDGTSCSINIANFTMRSGLQDVPVTGSPIHLLGYSTLYYVYYDDPDFTGGAVAFQATTVQETALAGENRYLVGSITTPGQGDVDTSGNNDGGAGAQSGLVTQLTIETATDNGPLGVTGSATTALTGLSNVNDGSQANYCEITVTGGPSSGATRSITVAGLAALNQKYSMLTLKAVIEVPTNSFTADPTQTVASLAVTFDDGNSVDPSYFLVNITAGVTMTKQLVSVTVPLNAITGFIFNPLKTGIFGGAEVNPAIGSGGTIVFRVYEMWLEAQ